MVAVPILAKAGDVIGVVVLHTAAPREFDDDVLNFLVHTASLVAGAIENAQLYEETRRRVQALTTLTQLSQALAAVTAARGPLRGRHAWRPRAAGRGRLPDLPPRRGGRRAGARRAPTPRRAGAEPAPGRDRPGARPDARGRNGRGRGSGAGRADAVARTCDEDALLVAPLVAGDEQLGIICCLAHDGQFADGGRGAARRRRQPDRRRAEEGRADRAPDGREHRQGHVRRARRGLGRGGARRRRARPAATSAGRHLFLHVERAPRAAGGAAAWPELAARFETRLRRLVPAGLLRLPPRPGAGAGAAAERERRRGRARCGRRASRWAARRGWWSA